MVRQPCSSIRPDIEYQISFEIRLKQYLIPTLNWGYPMENKLFERFAISCTNWAERWFPDPWVLAVVTIFVVAVATDSPGDLPEATGLPLFDLNDADAIVNFLLGHPERYEYHPELYFDAEHLAGAGRTAPGGPAAADADARRSAAAPDHKRPAAV